MKLRKLENEIELTVLVEGIVIQKRKMIKTQHCGLGGNFSQTLVLNSISFVDKRTLSLERKLRTPI